jgi:hypothetical protein
MSRSHYFIIYVRAFSVWRGDYESVFKCCYIPRVHYIIGIRKLRRIIVYSSLQRRSPIGHNDICSQKSVLTERYCT